MKTSILAIGAVVLLGNTALAQESATLRGNAASQSSTSVAADRSGASASHASSSSAGASTDQAAVNLGHGTELNATLAKPVDASKAKPGDRVTATLAQDVKSNGKVVLKKGTKLIGHVTAAQARGRASGSAAAQSKLGIVFDTALMKDGRELPVHATVQALAAMQSATATALRGPDTGIATTEHASGAARGGLVGGVGGSGGAIGGIAGTASGAVHSSAVATTGGVGRSIGAVGGVDAAGQLAAGSKGVFGMKGLDITSAGAGSAEGSVITSASRNVRLDSGTRMLLVTGTGANKDTASATEEATSEPVDRNDTR